MKKRWWIVTGSLWVGIGVVLTIPALLSLRPGVTKANFSRIEETMTRAEVEAIFGETGQDRIGMVTWQNEKTEDEVEIVFDENDRVKVKRWLPNWDDDRTDFEKLLDRLPWRNPKPVVRRQRDIL